MSIHIVTEAWDFSSAEGSCLLVLLALADNANKQTRLAWPSVEDLARRSRLSERQVQRHLRKLEEMGDITLVKEGVGTGTGGGLTAVYRVHPGSLTVGDMSVTHDSTEGDTQGIVRATPMSPQPSKEPSGRTSDEVLRVSQALEDHVKEVTGRDKKLTATDYTTIERMLRIDGVDPDEAVRMLRWLDKAKPGEPSFDVADFWRPNILSAKKLREKFPQIRAQASRRRPNGSAGIRRDGMTEAEHREAILNGARRVDEMMGR